MPIRIGQGFRAFITAVLSFLQETIIRTVLEGESPNVKQYIMRKVDIKLPFFI
jgi:hypothetical protein